jgi:PAS domain S-box-containing protein
VRRSQSLALIAACLAVVGAGAAWRGVSVRDALFDRVERRLEGNAAGTVAAVERWIEERRYDAATIADEVGEYATPLPVSTPRSDSATGHRPLGRLLHRIRAGHGYLNAWALDSAGVSIASAVPGVPTEAERRAARTAFATGTARLCDPFVLPDGRIALCYAVAARDAGGLREIERAARRSAPTFVIVLRSDPYGSLAPLVEASDVATGTERTQLVARVGDSIAILAGSRPGPGGRRTIGKLAWSVAPPLLKEAIGGASVHGRHRGVGGREMLGGARHVRGTEWAVVRRVDLAEIQLAFWRQMRTELLLLGAALAAAALAVASAVRKERGRRRRELAASEARLADTLRSSFDAVIAVDDDGRIQLFNAAAERLFGRTAAEVMGQPATFISPPRLLDGHMARFAAFLASDDRALAVGGSPLDMAVRANGEEFAFEAMVSKGVAEGRRLSTLVVRDVSERQRAEEEREHTLSLLRATLESTADGILVVDLDGRVAAFNRQFRDLWELPDGLIEVGRGGSAALLAAARAKLADPDAFVERVRAIYRTPEEESRDMVELADGRLIERVSKPQRVGDRVVGRVWSLRDVTERERATAALRQGEKLAAVGQFVSGVAHELNNPLAAVLLFTEGMLQEHRTAEDAESLELVRDQARRARAIVRDLLAFVRGANGEMATVDARELVEQATRALERQVAADGARLELHVRGELGAVRVDRPAIEQVVTNLVQNAVHAAPGGTVRVVASVEAGDTAPQLVVSVEDEGAGIADEVLPRIFEPFFTTKPVGVGTGLGLSVSLGIAQRHGGGLRAENRRALEGRGARLVLTLPLTRPTVRRAEPPRTPEAVVTPLALASRPRVLVVDDEPPIRRALRTFFARRAWDVEEAEHGQAALDRILTAEALPSFDLIISDLKMPGISGAMLHDRIAVERPELLDRFVVSTGDAVSADAAAFVARTRCAVLEKPFELSALDAIVREVVARETPPRGVLTSA